MVKSSSVENKSKSINFYIFMFQTFNLALMPGFWMEGKLKEGRFNIIVKSFLSICD